MSSMCIFKGSFEFEGQRHSDGFIKMFHVCIDFNDGYFYIRLPLYFRSSGSQLPTQRFKGQA